MATAPMTPGIPKEALFAAPVARGNAEEAPGGRYEPPETVELAGSAEDSTGSKLEGAGDAPLGMTGVTDGEGEMVNVDETGEAAEKPGLGLSTTLKATGATLGPPTRVVEVARDSGQMVVVRTTSSVVAEGTVAPGVSAGEGRVLPDGGSPGTLEVATGTEVNSEAGNTEDELGTATDEDACPVVF